MNVQSLVIRLEAWIQEELGSQGRMIQLLEAQEKAIIGGDRESLVAAGDAVDEELRSQPKRVRSRASLLDSLGRRWGVAPETLTLSSIAERCEGEGLTAERLRGLRSELRRSTAELLKRGRRVGTLVRFHQGLLSDLVNLMFGGRGLDDTGAAASLVDARV